MNSEQFVYWLQGMLEYTDVSKLNTEDLKIKLQGIKDHLKLVFTKVTPTPVEDKKTLTQIAKDISDGVKKESDEARRFREAVEDLQKPRREPLYKIPNFSRPSIDPKTWPIHPDKGLPNIPTDYPITLPTGPYYMTDVKPGTV